MYKKIGKVIVDSHNLDVLKACVEISEPVLMVGETGTGKTTLLSELAKRHKKVLHRISVNGSTGVEEILGKWLIEKSTTKWQDGLLINAMKNGDWVVFDEINSALPEILFSLHSLLDDDKQITLTEKSSEVIKPHKDFRFFGAMNPSDEYAGTKDMNKAFVSRFNAVVNVETLTPRQEEKAVKQQTDVSEEEAMQLVDIGVELRKKKENDEIFYFCSTRDLIQAGKLIKQGLVFEKAVMFAIGNKMSKDELKSCNIPYLVADVERQKERYTKLSEILSKFSDIEVKLANAESEIGSLTNQLNEKISSETKLRTAYNNLSSNLAKQLQAMAEAEIPEEKPVKKKPVKKKAEETTYQAEVLGEETKIIVEGYE